jgi:prepilin-type N-terminal cleavage/methylation domain-containing protein
MTRMRRRARRGMTLMELVIGLAITGMMAAAGAAAFSSIIDHRKTVRESSVSTERAGALREMIESWLLSGQVQLTLGGVPRGLGRGAAAPASGARNSPSVGGASTAAVTAATGGADELTFTTQGLNPSLLGLVRIRLYIDADANTPETGLSIEYQPNLQQPLVRKMLDSTVDSLRVEYRDLRTGRWFPSAQVATIQPVAVRMTLLSSRMNEQSRILSVPMIFAPIGLLLTNNAQVAR